MKPVKIKIAVEGTNQNNVPLSEFVYIASTCYKLLEQTAKGALNNLPCDFLLSDLTHDSPAAMIITPTSLNPDAGLLIADSLTKQIGQINSGNSGSLPSDILKSWNKVINRCSNGNIGDFSMKASDDALKFSNSILSFEAISIMEQALNLARKNETVCLTSIIGRVEVVDMHNKKKIKVYPRVKEWNHVDVSFDDSLTKEVLISMNKVAEISGKGHYHHEQLLPYKMQMKSIRILPDLNTLPKLSDMKGIAPNITGGKSVQEYMDDLRKEWER